MSDLVTTGNSLIDNQTFNYMHYAWDYAGTGPGTLNVQRRTRFRDMTEPSSFGPGVFSNFDIHLHLEDGGYGSAGATVDLFDPSGLFAKRMITSDGIIYTGNDANLGYRRSSSVRELRLLDAQGVDAGQGGGWQTAVTAELTLWSGELLEFDIIQAVTGADPQTQLDGRLTALRDRKGYGTTLTYKSWTAAQIAESAERQWQLDTVTDGYGNVATFHYGAQQVGGRWSISQIDLPNSNSVTYGYANDKLTQVDLPDGTQSTFTYGSNSTSQTTTIDFFDAAADGSHRSKRVYLANNAGASIDGIANQSSLLVRMVVNGDNEVSYMSMPGPGGSEEVFIYEGSGKMKRVIPGVNVSTAAYLEDGWTFAQELPIYGSSTLNKVEESGTEHENGYGKLHLNAPEGARSPTGVYITYDYDADWSKTKATYEDGTIEAWAYNGDKQVTRYKDRMDRVTKYTYDPQGNMLTQEVGIQKVEVSGGGGSHDSNGVVYQDQNQPEHAVYSWEYYPAGNANEFLLKTEFSPLYDAATPDLHRIDYEYDGNHRITKRTDSADVTGGNRPETTFTYDANGRLETTTDPVGNTTTYAYDARNRLVRTTFADASAAETLYGTAAGEENLVVKTKDRRNVVTTYAYDDTGRPTQTIVGAATDADILDGNPDDSPNTDRNTKRITDYAYVTGKQAPASMATDNKKTDYVYDYRGRAIETTRYPAAGKQLTTKREFKNNQLHATEDPYGRKTFYGYSASDGGLIRTITGAVPSYTLADNTAVMAEVRDLANNASYVVRDAITNANGELDLLVDGRGVQKTTEYDSRGQSIRDIAALGTAVEAKTERDYDANGKVAEIRTPRYFDANDPEAGNVKTVMTYTGRGLLASRTVAPGTPEEASESYTYYDDGRQKVRTDARGHDWKSIWQSCCGYSAGSADPYGHGSITNADASGKTTHVAQVSDVETHTSLLDPDDAKTITERTSRYDILGRSSASTTWLVPLGVVDQNNPSIAGLDGVSENDGLTSQSLYDPDLTDGVGLDSAAGLTVQKLGGGTYNVSLTSALTKLAETAGNGGGDLSFVAGSAGSASLQINGEEEVSFSISDGTGRSVMSGIVEPHDGTAPNALLTWSCSIHDTTANISGFGDVAESTSVNALGHVTKSRTDGAGRTVETEDAEQNVSTFQYDANGNTLVSRDPNNVGQDCVYDELNRDTSCTDTANSTTGKGYDREGQVIKETDAKNKDTLYVFDARGNRLQETDRLNFITSWAYDKNGNQLGLTDAENQTTLYSYDNANRRVTEQYPDHVAGSQIGDAGYSIITSTYDEAGRLTEKEDQQGDTTTYNLDMAGRMLSRVYVGHATGPLANQTDADTFTYDKVGRMLSGHKGRYNNDVTFTYDDRGQQTQETLTTHNQTYTVGYEKNELDQTTKLTYPNGAIVDRAYTDRGQLQSVDYTPTGGTLEMIATFTYDAGSRETTRNLGNGLTTTRGYFNDNQIQSIATPSVETLTYTYDTNKNPTSETRSGVMAPYSWTTGPTGFDDEDRHVNWSRTNGDSQSWNLSPVHDWTSTTINGTAQTRTHNPSHEIATMSGAEVPGGSATLTHDTKGNTTTDERGCTLTWDFDNMLGAFIANGVTNLADVTYEYDAIGRRVAKNVAQPGGAAETTVFANADQQTLTEYTGTNTKSYVYASYIDEPLVADDGTEKHYFHRNRQYSIYAITASAGTVTERYSYASSGQLTTHSDLGGILTGLASGNQVAFTGRVLDFESEFYCFRRRMYSSVNGCFLSRDPLKYVDGNNLRTAYFNPSATDPSGEIVPVVVACVVVGAVLFCPDPVNAPSPNEEPHHIDPGGSVIIGGGIAAAPFLCRAIWKKCLSAAERWRKIRELEAKISRYERLLSETEERLVFLSGRLEGLPVGSPAAKNLLGRIQHAGAQRAMYEQALPALRELLKCL